MTSAIEILKCENSQLKSDNHHLNKKLSDTIVKLQTLDEAMILKANEVSSLQR
jgi:hypothetical protein